MILLNETSKIFEKVSKTFRKIFGFGWGALPPRPPEFWLGGLRHPRHPPLTGLAGGRPDPPRFFVPSVRLTTGEPPGRPAERSAERPAGRRHL